MRSVLPVVSLLLAIFSIALGRFTPAPGSRLWTDGACRQDQVYAAIDADGSSPRTLAALVNADPANPLVWCSYAEQLSARGEVEQAGAAFEHAVSLGPGMSPVLMRAANFDFTRGRRGHGVLMTSRILLQTDVFDQILFSYLQQSGLPASSLAGNAIPARPRPAQSWLVWLSAHGSDRDLLSAWAWMRLNRLYNPESASDLAWTLWNRKSYEAAQKMWLDWLGPERGEYLHPQRVGNRHFKKMPGPPGPFDWTLTPLASVELCQQDGLQIRFSGTENVDFAQVRQYATVSPGHYRFSAEVEADGLTTDQRPFFHIFDPIHPNAVNVTTEPVEFVMPRSWITLRFAVPAGTFALAVQLERRSSQRFASRIAGSLHVYEVSLVPERPGA